MQSTNKILFKLSYYIFIIVYAGKLFNTYRNSPCIRYHEIQEVIKYDVPLSGTVPFIYSNGAVEN